MKQLMMLALFSVAFSQELKVEGDLNVTGNILNSKIDSLEVEIDSLKIQLLNQESLNTTLQSLINLLQSQIIQLQIQTGLADCNGVISGEAFLDPCGNCVNEFNLVECSNISDIDGNVYQILLIGEQIWMTENLKVTHYNNGEYIHGDYIEDNGEIYYNANVVNNVNEICPEGWHVPTDEEFQLLEIYLGMQESWVSDVGYRGTNEGSKLAGNSGSWTFGDLIENSEFNESGFNVAGKGWYDMSFAGLFFSQQDSYFWTKSIDEEDENKNFVRNIRYDNAKIRRATEHMSYGFSIRCLAN
tara:strand:+ start:62 stop:961 length:900 start_codon:yes stop_codon:yes gene_type:complete